MIYSILYAVLAALALGILVFVHELGHYFVARREGMKIEAFSIGFGKPIFTWKRGSESWQLCWIPFGGQVKIAQMEGKDALKGAKDGFYGKSPWSRIKVALAGPLANIFLAFLLFSLVWIGGGREKMFSEYTHLIGWVDTDSDLYKKGVHPGDEILSYGGKSFKGFQQLMYSALLDQGPQEMKGMLIDYPAHTEIPFSYTVDFGDTVKGFDKASLAANMISPANYLIYSDKNPLLEDSPMLNCGLQDGDKILWVDGELIFSKKQLVSVVNQPKTLLTVLRGDKIFLTRIPRLQIGDLRLSALERAEFQDVGYALGFQSSIAQLYSIPYALLGDCTIQSPLCFIDEMAVEQKLFSSAHPLETALEPGDRILAVDGKGVYSFNEFFTAIQTKHVQMIVVRGQSYSPISWKDADAAFMEGVSFGDLNRLVASIGLNAPFSSLGNLHLLKPIEPKPRMNFPLTYSLKDRLVQAIHSQKKQAEGVDVSEENRAALRQIDQSGRQMMLGVALQDRPVFYNPSPFALMLSACQETWQTLYALVTGYLSPKYMSGPVGIVQVIHHGWAHGVKEALFWIAVISINLGLVNLLPIPVLDGGHICFSLYEMITGKKINEKVLEKLIIPFFVLLVLFFIYLTYQDILRLLGKFF
jgi:regulator of sigma E protease